MTSIWRPTMCQSPGTKRNFPAGIRALGIESPIAALSGTADRIAMSRAGAAGARHLQGRMSSCSCRSEHAVAAAAIVQSFQVAPNRAKSVLERQAAPAACHPVGPRRKLPTERDRRAARRRIPASGNTLPDVPGVRSKHLSGVTTEPFLEQRTRRLRHTVAMRGMFLPVSGRVEETEARRKPCGRGLIGARGCGGPASAI
jgi:hypothetical protein